MYQWSMATRHTTGSKLVLLNRQHHLSKRSLLIKSCILIVVHNFKSYD